MLDSIDALVALATFGTVSEAATRLRLTQSAVSKRLQSLQSAVGFRLLEPDGRRLRLTAPAVEFLARARPLVAELRGLVGQPAARDAKVSFSLALADSIASSWGPAVIRQALRALPGSQVALHAHRSILVIECVRLGRYDIGLCTEAPTARDLVQQPLIAEPLVLVHAELAPRKARAAPLITIEPTSATWRAIQPQLRAHHPDLLAAPARERERGVITREQGRDELEAQHATQAADAAVGDPVAAGPGDALEGQHALSFRNTKRTTGRFRRARSEAFCRQSCRAERDSIR